MCWYYTLNLPSDAARKVVNHLRELRVIGSGVFDPPKGRLPPIYKKQKTSWLVAISRSSEYKL